MVAFEWDDTKAARNPIDHKVSFEQAAAAFLDAYAVEWLDMRVDYGEERSGLLGVFGREVLYVAYTERGDTIRIISARRTEKHEQNQYYRQNAP
jgi:uncharacterized protein